MRILQLIDSLDAGGAERIAVNYANSLTQKVSFSGLVTTRKEGVLKTEILQGVSYLFLERKNKIDFKAISILKKFILENKVDIVHAHGTSYFLGFVIKLLLPKLKLIYHEHNGNRINQSKTENVILVFCSLFFFRVFTVTPEIELWSIKNLFCKKVNFIYNFAILNTVEKNLTILQSENSNKIVCLANLRNPKNHLFLLQSFFELNPVNWTLHLIGKDYLDDYSNNLKKFIVENKLEKSIYIYNDRLDIKHILNQAKIGLLCSTYEGFPMSLLEYGLANLAVISSNVGYCKNIITNDENGLLFQSSNKQDFKTKLSRLINDYTFREKIAKKFNVTVNENYSEKVIITKLLFYYQK